MRITYGEALRQVFSDFERGELSWFEYKSRKTAILRDSKCHLNRPIPDHEKRIAISLVILGMMVSVIAIWRWI
jgi:hypothetical protein